MHELGSRKREQPAPPSAVWEALVDPFRPGARQWMEPVDDEVVPTVVESVRPHLVVWSSLWPDRPDDRIRFDLEPHRGGTMLRWTLSSPDEPPDESRVGHMRHRLNELINAELRYSFGQ